MATELSLRAKSIIRNIPQGKVSTYGLIAAACGNPKGARQVARLLHSCATRDNLPWHRVVNRLGRISLPPFQGYEIQKNLLLQEGVCFLPDDSIDLNRYLWNP